MTAKQVFGTSHVPLSPAVRAGDLDLCLRPGSGRADGGPSRMAASESRPSRSSKTSRLHWRWPGRRCDDVVKTTVWLDDARDFGAFNQVYAELLRQGAAGAHDCGRPADAGHQGGDRGRRLRTLRLERGRCASSPHRWPPKPTPSRRSRPTAPASTWRSTRRRANIRRRRRCAPRRWWCCAGARGRTKGSTLDRRHRDLGRAGRADPAPGL